MSKTEFYDLIKLNIANNEFLAKKIFSEFDTKILVPNKFVGAIEVEKEEEEESGDENKENEVLEQTISLKINTNTETKNSPTPTPQTTTTEVPEVAKTEEGETAEDILREIEDPTPTNLPTTIRQNEDLMVIKQPIKIEDNVDVAPLVRKTEIQPTQIQQPQQQIKVEVPDTKVEKPVNNEAQLDSKLTETVIQPAKSTYYKVDPYREQAE